MPNDDPVPTLEYATPPDARKLNQRMSDRLATLALVAFYVALFWPMVGGAVVCQFLNLRPDAVIVAGSLGFFLLFILLMSISGFLHRLSTRK